jgi:hypothetical protein
MPHRAPRSRPTLWVPTLLATGSSLAFLALLGLLRLLSG